MTDITPFDISVSDDALSDLRKRLELSRFPDELADSGTALGAPLADVKRLHNHWLHNYDWRAQETRINSSLPQYTAPISIDGFGELKIHFVHAPSAVKNAIPLLFCHGWPGSFLEVSKILPGLVKGGPDAPAFHVVAPSLPGYGFSEGAKKKGLGPAQCAEMCHNLMQKLGYKQYVTQGGDWGYVVTRLMGFKYPSACLASHYNLFVPNVPKPWTAPLIFAKLLVTPWTKEEREGVDRARWFQDDGFGYFKEQSTRPQTIGYAVTDSPVGLLGWIYEKLVDWTDEYPWTDDEVLTWVSIYWFATAGPVGGMRLYYEAEHVKGVDNTFASIGGYLPDVKLGLSRFPKELVPLPMKWNSLLGPVVFEKEHPKGGHFAAWECPDSIVGDLRDMFGKGGGAYEIVSRKGGYLG